MTDLVSTSPKTEELDVRSALKLAEARNLYGTIAIQSEPPMYLHVVNGRLLNTDQDGREINPMLAIAAGISEGNHCRILPLWEVEAAHERQTLPIPEALVAAIRLTAASATLAFDPEASSEDILVSTLKGGSEGVSNDPRQKREEADRLRAEFFERRSHRSALSSGGLGLGARDAAQQRYGPADRRRSSPSAATPWGKPATRTSTTPTTPPSESAERSDQPARSGATARTTTRQTPRTTAVNRAKADERPKGDVTGKTRSTTESTVQGKAGGTADEEKAERTPSRRSALRSLIRNLVP